MGQKRQSKLFLGQITIEISDFLVRLEFELKLEPLLLYSPAPAPTAATPPPPLC